ncbi:homoserine dehydrogenase [Sinobacterium caligoides]|uniref:Homoserine dehydrogenase n=1 Tax=Sinobacterium caligoides TaxID=933926 RepID=A0A3N2DZK7_9GAMM|nr:homoserine dehydrogenase [Sinobacterium caligoides]ROS05207.1 homoserine dehydrogenase [Sinobacterium caligoides]
MKPVRIGICGLGTVASGTVNILTRNCAEITGRAGCDVIIEHIGARRDNPLCDTTGYKVSRDIFAVVDDPNVDVVVELIGGYDVAKDLVLKAIANGKHVVTANKALIAVHGNEIFAAAKAQGVSVCYEAAVAGGIPIIKAVREGLAANRVEWLAGIINGTGNFILTEMRDKGRAFDDVLKEAQALGYAEADPTFDVEGIDAAHKLAILASIAFGIPLQFDKAYTEGIAEVSTVDVEFAEELGYRIKHLGIARRQGAGVELRVHPTLIPEKSLIANVHGVMNAVMVQGDAVGTTLYYGAGAGAEPTASAVVADLVDLARGLDGDAEHRVAALGFHADKLNDLPIVDAEQFESAYYLRMSAEDKPGVLSAVAQIISEEGISVEALIQREPLHGESCVPMIILTNRTQEARMTAALIKLKQLDSVSDEIVRIRVDALDA